MALLHLLPLKLNPSASMPALNISYSMDGTSKMVESEMTSRIEAMLSRMKGVVDISSRSYDGYGTLQVSFDKHTDIEAARFEASTLIRQSYTDFPPGASYPSISVRHSNDDASQAFMVYSINAIANPSDIINNVEKIFTYSFGDIIGVSDVNIYGARPIEWKITYDNNKIQELGLTADDIYYALQVYRMRQHIGDYTLTADAADTTFSTKDVFVALPDSSHISLDRIAVVKRKEARPRQLFRINGLNSIYLEIKADDNANQLTLKKQVEKRVQELSNLLPNGYELHKVSDNTEYISQELDKVYFRSGLTLLILILFIFITTLSWKHVTVILCSLASNLAIAVIVYYIMDVELQLYSLAGITISFNLIIDNAIIMVDHWRREHNLNSILPITAATLTTIGALSIVFFLDGRLKLNLYDFAAVIIINLVISVFTALLVVPSLLEKLGDDNNKTKIKLRRKRAVVRINKTYKIIILSLVQHRRLTIAILVLCFGLPIFLIPQSIDSDNWFAMLYNKTLGSEVYQDNIRPYCDAILGGSLRLFVDKVYYGSYWTDNKETTLNIMASLPYGSTIEQMDHIIRQMEAFLSKYPQISLFQTNISSPMFATVTIHFTQDGMKSGFPFMLHNAIVQKAMQIGGGSWTVQGLPDKTFNNDVHDYSGLFTIEMHGYNYEKLYQWADSVKSFLLSHIRIKEVEIKSEPSFLKNEYREYHLSPDMKKMARNNISASQLFYALGNAFVSNINCGYIWVADKQEVLVLNSSESDKYNIWELLNRPIELGGQTFKIGELCTFEKKQAPPEILKTNQQYKLCLQFKYIGSEKMGNKVSQEADSIYSAKLPIGFDIDYYRIKQGWSTEESQQYWLIALVVAIIFVITSILFNSIKMPFVILGIIPVSYIGLFMTFYAFSLNFDQGGFAALVLLCGITVNASIYIVNEYMKKTKKMSPLNAYIKSFNIKIIPILLTILSTILGFIPFLVGTDKEAFWFPLAAGTIGGLIFSIVGILFLLPTFCITNKVSSPSDD